MPGFSNDFGLRGFGFGRGQQHGLEYWQITKATAPARYLPLWDAVGAAAAVELMAGDNGTPTNVTFGATGAGDGKTAASFAGGSGNRISFFSASLATLDFSKGTLAAWAKPDPTIWTDSSLRCIAIISDGGGNEIVLYKDASNRLHSYYNAGGTTKDFICTPFSSTDWLHFAITFDKSAGANGQAMVYVNGTQFGATQTALGTWSAPPTKAFIGLYATTNTGAWKGSIAHVGYWPRALTPAEVAKLAGMPPF